jgi:hypothetical protein
MNNWISSNILALSCTADDFRHEVRYAPMDKVPIGFAQHPTKMEGYESSTSPPTFLSFSILPHLSTTTKPTKYLISGTQNIAESSKRINCKMSLSNKLSITDVDLKGKRVLIRVSLHIPFLCTILDHELDARSKAESPLSF